MDLKGLQEKGKVLFGKYKYALLILALGIFLMAVQTPVKHEDNKNNAEPVHEKVDRSEELAEILSKIDGVGKVQVMLSEAAGPETVYQTDEDLQTNADTESKRVETVIITDDSHNQTGLIRTITPPVYLGAIIVCQGAERPSIKLAIVEAVSNITGISTDRITVLKMK